MQAEGRVEALEDAVEELGHLEEYVRTMQPSKNDAISLSVRFWPHCATSRTANLGSPCP